MTKKDYVFIAGLIRQLIDYLKSDNPKFDEDKFIAFLKKGGKAR